VRAVAVPQPAPAPSLLSWWPLAVIVLALAVLAFVVFAK
jgi:hypothetical protein